MLKSEQHNTTGNIQWYVSTYSKEIYDDLSNLKKKKKKSGHEQIPPINEKYYRSFIRGLWDGDGFIRENLKGIGLVGSYECMNFVQQHFKNTLNIKPLKIYEHYNTYKI